MFALFGSLPSSREKFIQGLRLDPGLELFMKLDKRKHRGFPNAPCLLEFPYDLLDIDADEAEPQVTGCINCSYVQFLRTLYH